MSRRGGRGRDNDGKYCRLTGLWPSKNKDTLWTGKIRNQDIRNVQDKLEEADKGGNDVVVFLWENTKKESRKDPEFTAQIAVSEDQEDRGSRGSRRGGRGRDNDQDNDRDNDRDKDENEEEEEDEKEEEEQESRSRKSSKGKGKESSSRSRSSGKRDKNDW